MKNFFEFSEFWFEKRRQTFGEQELPEGERVREQVKGGRVGDGGGLGGSETKKIPQVLDQIRNPFKSILTNFE